MEGHAPLQLMPGRMEVVAVGLEPHCCEGKERDQAEGTRDTGWEKGHSSCGI